MDLLTVLSHEMGRLFGYHVGDAARHHVMTPTLAPGTRIGEGPAATRAPVGGRTAVPDPASRSPGEAGIEAAGQASPPASPGGVDPEAAPAVPGLAFLAPDLGGRVAAALPTPAAARFDRDRQRVVTAVRDQLPADTRTEPGPGGVLGPYSPRPTHDPLGHELDHLWVG